MQRLWFACIKVKGLPLNIFIWFVTNSNIYIYLCIYFSFVEDTKPILEDQTTLVWLLAWCDTHTLYFCSVHHQRVMWTPSKVSWSGHLQEEHKRPCVLVACKMFSLFILLKDPLLKLCTLFMIWFNHISI